MGKNPLPPDISAPCFEIAFGADDTAALKTAVEAGAALVQDVREEPWGRTIRHVRDPNGHLIEICSRVR